MNKISENVTRVDDNIYQYLLPAEPVNEQDPIEKSGIKRIEIVAPQELQGVRNYCLTQKVAAWINKHRQDLSLDMLKEGINITIKDPEIAGTWSVQVTKTSWLWEKCKNIIPGFFQTYESPQEVRLEVKATNPSMLSALNPFGSNTEADEHVLPPSDLSTDLDPYLSTLDPYTDAFTRLATKALQELEPNWVFSNETTGKYRMVIQDNKLILDEIKENQDKNQNSTAVKTFKKSLQLLYGDKTVNYAKLVYGIDLDKMIKEGTPLRPDDVFKCNIASLHLEMSDTEELLDKLKKLQQSIKDLTNDNLLAMCVADLSMREVRGLKNAALKFAGTKENSPLQQLKLLLNDILKNNPENPTKMKSADFNILMGMLEPTQEELLRACTGRAIIDRAITGFDTEGNKNVEDKCRDLFELRQMYKKLRKTDDWKNWDAQLAFVAVKKSLYTALPDPKNPEKTNLNVGLLIPGPKDANGQERWYRVDAFIDNGSGDVNYHLLPVNDDCVDKDGKRCPAVKLYRSTNSNTNAVGADQSLAADLNPFDSGPNTINPDIAYEQEKKFFIDRSIPTYVAFLEVAEKVKSSYDHPNTVLDDGEKALLKAKYQKYYQKSLDYFITSNKTHKDVKEAISLLSLMTSNKADEVFTLANQLINKVADESKELRKYKIDQKMKFVGQSLGGGLSQLNTHRLVILKDRLYIAGAECVSFCGPGAGVQRNEEFFSWGRDRRGWFKYVSDKKIRVDHNLEYSDFVPSVGGPKLGTNKYFPIKDKIWFDFSGEINTPLPTAITKEIANEPTHGRTFWYNSVEGRDFTRKLLTPFDVDESIAATLSLLKWPSVTEAGRRTLGWFLYPYFMAKEWLNSNNLPDKEIKSSENKKGVVYVEFQPNQLNQPIKV